MDVNKIVKLVACISAQDGIISKTELETAFKLINKQLGNINQKLFNTLIVEFFEEDSTLEDYLLSISNEIDPEVILEICSESAKSDGLDIRENIAFDKACKFWQRDVSSYI